MNHYNHESHSFTVPLVEYAPLRRNRAPDVVASGVDVGINSIVASTEKVMHTHSITHCGDYLLVTVLVGYYG